MSKNEILIALLRANEEAVKLNKLLDELHNKLVAESALSNKTCVMENEREKHTHLGQKART